MPNNSSSFITGVEIQPENKPALRDLDYTAAVLLIAHLNKTTVFWFFLKLFLSFWWMLLANLSLPMEKGLIPRFEYTTFIPIEAVSALKYSTL